MTNRMTRKRRLMKNRHKSRRNIGRGGAKILPLGVSDAQKQPSRLSLSRLKERFSRKKPTPSSKWECSCDYAKEDEDDISVASVTSMASSPPPQTTQRTAEGVAAGVAAAVAALSTPRRGNRPPRNLRPLTSLPPGKPQPQPPSNPQNRPQFDRRKAQAQAQAQARAQADPDSKILSQGGGGVNDNEDITKNVICSCKKRPATATV